jgi:hypothetical protein
MKQLSKVLPAGRPHSRRGGLFFRLFAVFALFALCIKVRASICDKTTPINTSIPAILYNIVTCEISISHVFYSG